MADRPLKFTMTTKWPARLPRAPKEVVTTVRFNMRTEGFEEATAKLREALDPNAMAAVIRVAVLRSLVVNIRRRYLANMERALEMKSLEQGGKAVANSPRVRMRDNKLKASLSSALADLNKAQLKNDPEGAQKVRTRISKLREQLVESLGKDASGRPGGHRLSQLSGNNFRKMLIALLGALTDAQFVVSGADAGRPFVGVGPNVLLDRFETPSATLALTGSPTRSRYRTFWRHLEFGTGSLRSAAKDRLNRIAKPPGPWWYGRHASNSLLLDGTLPMNFLTDESGNMYAEDLDALRQALTRGLDALFSA